MSRRETTKFPIFLNITIDIKRINTKEIKKLNRIYGPLMRYYFQRRKNGYHPNSPYHNEYFDYPTLAYLRKLDHINFRVLFESIRILEESTIVFRYESEWDLRTQEIADRPYGLRRWNTRKTHGSSNDIDHIVLDPDLLSLL